LRVNSNGAIGYSELFFPQLVLVHPVLTSDSLLVTVPLSPSPITHTIPLVAPADSELLPSIQIFKSPGPAHLVCPPTHPLSLSLSEFLDRSVALVSKADTGPRLAGEPGFVDSLALELDYDEAETGFADGFPFLFTSRSSLDELNRLAASADMRDVKGYSAERWQQQRNGESRGVEVERMRPNIVVDGCQAWDEDSWELVRFGDEGEGPLIYVVARCPRCPVSTRISLSLLGENYSSHGDNRGFN
jgi:hypothetical protein